jgi:hypothetical protein
MKGWRTLLFAGVVALAGVLEQFDWLQIVPAQWNGLVLVVVGIVVAWLRKITTTSVGEDS